MEAMAGAHQAARVADYSCQRCYLPELRCERRDDLWRRLENMPSGAPSGFRTPDPLIKSGRARESLGRFRNAVSVQQAGQSARLMGSDGDLLDDAYAAAVTHRRNNEVLDVDGGEVGGIEVVQPDRLAPGLERAVNSSVSPVWVPVADAAHAEGEDLLDLDEDFALVGVIEPQSRAFDFSASGLPVEFVADVVTFADAGCAPRRCAVGDGIDDQRGFAPPSAVLVLVQCQMSEAIGEMQWRPEPEHLERHGLPDDLHLLTDGPDAPGAIPRARNLGGLDLQHVAVDGDGALPGAPLGQTRVIGEQDALGCASLLAGFLDGDGRGAEDQVARDAVFIGFDDVADGAHRFDHFDADRPDGGGSVGGHRAGGEYRVLHSVAHDAECGVYHAAHRVVAHCRAEVERAFAVMSVEP